MLYLFLTLLIFSPHHNLKLRTFVVTPSERGEIGLNIGLWRSLRRRLLIIRFALEIHADGAVWLKSVMLKSGPILWATTSTKVCYLWNGRKTTDYYFLLSKKMDFVNSISVEENSSSQQNMCSGTFLVTVVMNQCLKHVSPFEPDACFFSLKSDHSHSQGFTIFIGDQYLFVCSHLAHIFYSWRSHNCTELVLILC